MRQCAVSPEGRARLADVDLAIDEKGKDGTASAIPGRYK